MYFSILFLVLGLLHAERVRAQGTFDWAVLKPSTSLTWAACYTGLHCTRLQVPLNYSDPDAGYATLAVTRIPSSLGPSDANYRGPVLFNPGGPGISGVDQLTGALGAGLALAVGPQFDVISFDPRGVGRSTPRADFLSSESAKLFWDYSANSNVINTTLSTSSVPRLWSQAQLLGPLAQAQDDGILPHITTDNVARDMLSIVEAHNETKLKYWGISYGSVLGATFATLFPDKIERMVIDGVLDMDAYFSGRWDPLMVDTDKVLQMFFEGCFSAGPQGCAFYASSPSQIHANFNALLDSVAIQPVPVRNEATNTFGVVDGAALKYVTMQALYTPYTTFPSLAKGFADLALGNGSTIFAMVSSLTSAPSTCNSTDQANTRDSAIAITCGDFVTITDSPTELEDYYKSIQNVSTFVDTFVLPRRVICSGWDVHPSSFKGPIGSNTSFPLLLIGNTADPVTPLRGAVKTSQSFVESVVLVQDSAGHTSLSSQSKCTAGYIGAYFANGTLPVNGTVCPIQNQLFAASI